MMHISVNRSGGGWVGWAELGMEVWEGHKDQRRVDLYHIYSLNEISDTLI